MGSVKLSWQIIKEWGTCKYIIKGLAHSARISWRVGAGSGNFDHFIQTKILSEGHLVQNLVCI